MTSPQHKLKKDKTFSQALTSAALSYTTNYGRAFKLEEIVIKASVNITETITITLDSVNGANYDTVLATKDLVAQSSYVFRPAGQLNLQAGDEIKIQCTNANVTGTIYGAVKSSEILN